MTAKKSNTKYTDNFVMPENTFVVRILTDEGDVFRTEYEKLAEAQDDYLRCLQYHADLREVTLIEMDNIHMRELPICGKRWEACA